MIDYNNYANKILFIIIIETVHKMNINNPIVNKIKHDMLLFIIIL